MTKTTQFYWLKTELWGQTRQPPQWAARLIDEALKTLEGLSRADEEEMLHIRDRLSNAFLQNVKNSSLKNYFTQLHRAIRIHFSTESGKLNESNSYLRSDGQRDHIACLLVDVPSEIKRENRAAQDEALEQLLNTPSSDFLIEDPDAIALGGREILTNAIAAHDDPQEKSFYLDLAVGLCLIAGLRPVEVLRDAVLEPGDSKFTIRLTSGQAKTRGVERAYEMPTLIEGEIVLEAYQLLRSLKDFSDYTTDNMIQGEQNKLRDRFVDLLDSVLPIPLPSEARKVYDTICYFWFAPHGIKEPAYIRAINGHSPEKGKVGAALHYLKYEISPQAISRYGGAKGVRLGEPGIEVIESLRKTPTTSTVAEVTSASPIEKKAEGGKSSEGFMEEGFESKGQPNPLLGASCHGVPCADAGSASSGGDLQTLPTPPLPLIVDSTTASHTQIMTTNEVTEVLDLSNGERNNLSDSNLLDGERTNQTTLSPEGQDFLDETEANDKLKKQERQDRISKKDKINKKEKQARQFEKDKLASNASEDPISPTTVTGAATQNPQPTIQVDINRETFDSLKILMASIGVVGTQQQIFEGVRREIEQHRQQQSQSLYAEPLAKAIETIYSLNSKVVALEATALQKTSKKQLFETNTEQTGQIADLKSQNERLKAELTQLRQWLTDPKKLLELLQQSMQTSTHQDKHEASQPLEAIAPGSVESQDDLTGAIAPTLDINNNDSEALAQQTNLQPQLEQSISHSPLSTPLPETKLEANDEDKKLDPDVVRSYRLVMEYNNQPGRDRDSMWVMSYPAMKELLATIGKATQSKIDAVKEALASEIQQHYQTHGLTERHNRIHTRNGQKITDFIKL
jgi:hypothetical protein